MRHRRTADMIRNSINEDGRKTELTAYEKEQIKEQIKAYQDMVASVD